MQSRSAWRWLARAAAVGTGAYAGYFAVTWLRYGHARRPSVPPDALLDRFFPHYEIVECHSIHVAAPVERAFQAATESGIEDSLLVQAIIRLREILLGAQPTHRVKQPGIIADAQSIGWGVLAEDPGHEIVMGAVTRPWEANVVFHALPAEEFAAFHEPGFVKIAWTLRADPIDAHRSIVRTETRVAATSPAARSRFRRYWSALSPGILLIRYALLRQVKRRAERPS